MKYKLVWKYNLVCLMSLILVACGGESNSSGNTSNDTQPTEKNSTQQKQTWLDAHNQYRRQHQVANLTWSDDIAESAQAYADSCPDGHSNTKYGENIAYATAKQTANDVVKRWYDEEKVYDYANPNYDAKTGHFTQIVWKNTSQVGCGQASNCQGKWKDIVICQYNPAGNYLNQFGTNVLPKK